MTLRSAIMSPVFLAGAWRAAFGTQIYAVSKYGVFKFVV